MEAIIEQLGLNTLLERFNDEKVDPHVVLAMSESALIRLGVATMDDRIRMKQLCRGPVDCIGDSNDVDSFDRDASGSSASAAEQMNSGPTYLNVLATFFYGDPTEDIAESSPSFDEEVVDAGHHLPTCHLTLSGVAPFATPEGASLDTPAPRRVSPGSSQVPSGTASDTTHAVTGTNLADIKVPSLEASASGPIQSGANLVGTQLPSRHGQHTMQYL
ncbi:hypothetical protein AWC38_SpisGene804 [Stylophora pistillata]|uniref:SAM domain-containing protein n=1 Tax=Stylophora pistillata TaxID=50429 RepID=A0A2B4T0Y6_STYPI|nr:hypothetical protein AWC38_SpisGene804 [Stylophora pistillata]